MKITPLILGKGRAGQAIAKSWMSLKVLHPELGLEEPRWLAREAPLAEERAKYPNAVLCISQPHGLHADAIRRASESGFDAIFCEKPACVREEEITKLRGLKTPTAIAHVYRQMWGPQTLKSLISEGAFGDLITIEGRYWQASTAERALTERSRRPPLSASWKNDQRLSGEFDTYLDTGTHWLDAARFLFGAKPTQIEGWRSYANAESPHRDSHVQVSAKFGAGRAFASISKTMHGATNHFELNVIGTRAAGTWNFLTPDEIVIGEGRDRRVVTRKSAELGSEQPPHHSMGWLEGYIEIAKRLVETTYYGKNTEFPRLEDNLDLLSAMLATRWSQ